MIHVIVQFPTLHSSEFSTDDLKHKIKIGHIFQRAINKNIWNKYAKFWWATYNTLYGFNSTVEQCKQCKCHPNSTQLMKRLCISACDHIGGFGSENELKHSNITKQLQTCDVNKWLGSLNGTTATKLRNSSLNVGELIFLFCKFNNMCKIQCMYTP